MVVQLDQRDPAQVAHLFQTMQDQLGTPTILVNNAGIDSTGKHVKDMSIEEWDNEIKTNLYGPFFCCQQFIRRLEGTGKHGVIINITSVHQEIPRAGAAGYDVAKGGLRNLTTTLALELAEKNININNIAPGMVLTPFNQQAIDRSQGTGETGAVDPHEARRRARGDRQGRRVSRLRRRALHPWHNLSRGWRTHAIPRPRGLSEALRSLTLTFQVLRACAIGNGSTACALDGECPRAGTTVKSIGEAAYTYPMMKASQAYLWRLYSRYGYYPCYPRFHFGFGFGHGYRHGHGLHFGFHHFFHH